MKFDKALAVGITKTKTSSVYVYAYLQTLLPPKENYFD